MKKSYIVTISIILILLGCFTVYYYVFLSSNSCIQVLVSATHRLTGEEKVFGDPCSVPFCYKVDHLSDYNPEFINQDEGKVYTVKEALAVISISPNDYINKSININAVHADSVLGIGCNDYMILMDKEDAVRKQYLMDFLTKAWMDKAESEKITKELQNLPSIKTGETLTAVPGLFPTESGIYQGHFYDEKLTRKCEDGEMRFVIENKIKELGQVVDGQ